jgi:hypothetical protein
VLLLKMTSCSCTVVVTVVGETGRLSGTDDDDDDDDDDDAGGVEFILGNGFEVSDATLLAAGGGAFKRERESSREFKRESSREREFKRERESSRERERVQEREREFKRERESSRERELTRERAN